MDKLFLPLPATAAEPSHTRVARGWPVQSAGVRQGGGGYPIPPGGPCPPYTVAIPGASRGEFDDPSVQNLLGVWIPCLECFQPE